MRPDDDDFAALVIAGQFQLVDDFGQVVMDLDAPDAPLGATLNMLHHEPTVRDSWLGWSVNPLPVPGQAVVELQGPTPLAETQGPELELAANWAGTGLNRAGLTAGQRGGPTAVLGLTAAANPGPSQASLVVNNASLVLDGTAATGNARMDATTRARVTQGASQLDMNAGSLLLDAPVGSATIAAGGTAAIGLSNAGITVQHNSDGFFQAIGGNTFGGGSGRLHANGKPVYHCVYAERFIAPASVNVPFRSFIMNGLTSTQAGQVGDRYVITLSPRVICTAAGGAWIGEIQGFGGGFGVDVQRCIATGWAVGHDASLSQTWVLTQTVAGIVTWAIVGGSTAGTWVMVNPDSQFSVQHFAIR